ncbi:formate dehydrogenase accessory sulfurtransferase FdhD [Gordonia phthalatica]|uniref:Sulfur carrier protein FdhD n=1 Tax=Gordonia phthalatica TaxID=1136941 RepID=A0A0N9MRF8_9ACTN|nr:formate dehydrogenase accessory sulfurtransferase FdhD [Gordonia phthalatica]ALG85013.1 formate dehydrogenase [Gordonia phthalatica]
MGRITTRWPVTKVAVGQEPRRRPDVLAVEEPLEIRISGRPYTVTMRTPGNDIELAAGFLVSEGIMTRAEHLDSGIHCGGPTGGDGENTYNTLNLTLGVDVEPPDPARARDFYTTSACGVCGTTSIEEVESTSSFDVSVDHSTVEAALLTELPDRLRSGQRAFDTTGGLHAAALFDAASGDLLVLREDVGRHNAVDKVVGWAVNNDRLPLRGTVLQVSGRASFELVQKAVMAGIPILAAVSAPSSLAAQLAERSGLTLIGFLRGESMNIYTRPDRVRVTADR